MQGTRQPWQSACCRTISVALSSLGYDVQAFTLYGHVMLCSQPPVSFHGVILILRIQCVPAWLDAPSMICITSMDSGHLSTLSSQFLHRMVFIYQSCLPSCRVGGWAASHPRDSEDNQNAKRQSDSTPDLNTVIQHQHAIQRAVCKNTVATCELE